MRRKYGEKLQKGYLMEHHSESSLEVDVIIKKVGIFQT